MMHPLVQDLTQLKDEDLHKKTNLQKFCVYVAMRIISYTINLFFLYKRC